MGHHPSSRNVSPRDEVVVLGLALEGELAHGDGDGSSFTRESVLDAGLTAGTERNSLGSSWPTPQRTPRETRPP
jgi:hypothetical protein